jgi:hypothetical protein
LVILKPGLGKGLGDLMRGDQVAGKDRSGAPVAEPSADLGRGLKTLIQADAAVPQSEGAAPRSLLPPWFYFAADLLLLAYTVAIALDASRPFEPGTVLFCFVSIALGAMLAIVGVMQAATRSD